MTELEASRGLAPVAGYQAMLSGVVIGGRLMQVSPPVGVYFVTPQAIRTASTEQRL